MTATMEETNWNTLYHSGTEGAEGL